jgi:hypothetical protein
MCPVAENDIRPITPSEVVIQHRESIPSIIIDAFNKLIVKHFSPVTKESTVKQDEVLDMVCGEDTFSRSTVFKNHWLDVEAIYREQGWDVRYDKPAYNENYDAYFVFSFKK